MNYEAIPEELKDLKNWGLYKLIWKPERNKFTKIPYQVNGNPGKSNAPETWVTFDEAKRAMEELQLDGLAFFFSDGYVGIDIDNIKDDIERYVQGDITDNIVHDFVSHTQSYAETSVSGNGIHIIVRADYPGSKHRHANVEMYSEGRFFALTGNFFGRYKNINTADITYLYQKYLDPIKNVLPLRPGTQAVPTFNDLSTDEVIQKALESKNGKRFESLLKGEWQGLYNSQSDADMSFANSLAFWTAKDFSKMDTIFRSSGLMRDKYDEKRGKVTYGIGLLNKAISEANEVYRKKDDSKDFELIVKNSKSSKKKYYSYDDTGNSQRMYDKYGDILKYDANEEHFYYFDGKVWRQDTKMIAQQLGNRIIENIAKEPVVIPKDADAEEAKAIEKARKAFIKKSRNNSGKRGMLAEYKPLVAIDINEFDTENNVINTPSGYVDLTTGELKETTYKDKFTKITNYEYSETLATPAWDKFLNETFLGDQELIKFVQKAVGYSLTGTTSEQVIFICHGNENQTLLNGSNGKSVFLDMINMIFGSYSDIIAPEALLVDKFGNSSNGATPEITKMKGTRILTTSETERDARLSESLIKRVTGGEEISARKMYGNPFTFRPTSVIWMSTNNKPIIRGTDNGIWRRLVLLPFYAFIPDDKQDFKLKDKLLREAPGIINWAVEGALLWQKERLKKSMPKNVADSAKEYRHDMDTIGNFIEDRCLIGSGLSSTFKELSKAFDEWQDETGNHMTKRQLSAELKSRFSSRKSNGDVIYQNIMLDVKYKPFNLSVTK